MNEAKKVLLFPKQGPQTINDDKIIEKLLRELNISKGGTTSYKTFADMSGEPVKGKGFWRIFRKFRRRVEADKRIRVKCQPGNAKLGAESEFHYLDDEGSHHQYLKDYKSWGRRGGRLRRHVRIVNVGALSEEKRHVHQVLESELRAMGQHHRRVTKEIKPPRAKELGD